MENQEEQTSLRALYRANNSTTRRELKVKTSAPRFHEYQNGEIHGAKPPINYSRDFVNYDLLKTPLYGYELEVQACGRKEKNLMNLMWEKHLGKGEFYFCMDGSLNDVGNGVEIVSKAKSEAEIRALYVRYFNLLKGTAAAGIRSHDTQKCGLHVHVSRLSMQEEQWKSIRAFVVKHKEFFIEVSRREDCYYCEFRADDSGRYRAINLQNEHTVEFRFFRGTLLGSSFLASLECVFSLVNYFKELNPEGRGPRIDDYKSFVAERYKIFQNYIAERGLTRVGLTEAQKTIFAKKEELRQVKLREMERSDCQRRLLTEINAFYNESRSFRPVTVNPNELDGNQSVIYLSEDGRTRTPGGISGEAYGRITIMANISYEGDWPEDMFGERSTFYSRIPIYYYSPKLYGNIGIHYNEINRRYETEHLPLPSDLISYYASDFVLPEITVVLKRDSRDGAVFRIKRYIGALQAR